MLVVLVTVSVRGHNCNSCSHCSQDSDCRLSYLKGGAHHLPPLPVFWRLSRLARYVCSITKLIAEYDTLLSAVSDKIFELGLNFSSPLVLYLTEYMYKESQSYSLPLIWASWNLHVLVQESSFFSFLISRIDYSSFFNMNSPKNFTCLSAKLRKEFSSLLENPPAPCYRKLKLSLYAVWQQELTNTCTCNYSTLHRNI